jgi:hypothetical protein
MRVVKPEPDLISYSEGVNMVIVEWCVVRCGDCCGDLEARHK